MGIEDTIASPFVDCFAGSLKDCLIPACVYVVSTKDYLVSFKQEVRGLQVKKKDLMKDIEDAKREGKTQKEEVTLWLQRVDELQDELSKMEVKFQKRFKCLGVCYPNISSSYKLSRSAEKMIKDAKDLKENMPKEYASGSVPYDYVEMPTADLVVGMDLVLEQLQRLVDDDKVSTIGIHGMGGVGKTELLKKFYNQPHLKRKFDIMIWIDMDSFRNIEDVQKSIADEMGLIWKVNENKGTGARRIYDYLNKKAFVLVLDNLWRMVDLNDVGIPTAAATREAKSKVILATRIENVCDNMEATEKVKVNCLKWEEAWRLFIEKAGENLVEHDPVIRHHAETLVRKCGGLPLALITIGRAMASKRTPELWMHAITSLENAPLEIQGMEHVLTKLKHSYDNLSTNKLRTCLFYCTICQEDGDIDKNSVIDYCIGEGVIDDHSIDGDEVNNEGLNLLDTLKGASMLEPGGSPNDFRMHPMIHVLALWAEGGGRKGKKWLIRVRKGLTEAPEVDNWREVERVSLKENNIQVLSKRPNAPCLLSLLLNHNPITNIRRGFFVSVINLRVLDLSRTSLQVIPAEIGRLVQLQYLDFCHTDISSLPFDLAYLTRLKFLLLDYTPELYYIPSRLIPKLSQLRTLKMYQSSYASWEAFAFHLYFEELHSLKRLQVLNLTVESVTTLQKLARSPRLADSTNKLEIRFCSGLTTLSTATLGSEYKSLQCLLIRQCFDLKELEIVGGNTPSNLTTLLLRYLPKAIITWKSGCLQNINRMTVGACEEIRQLIHCDDNSIVAEEDDESPMEMNVLPKLRELHLYNLPKLESLTCGRRPLAFPCLEVIEVECCPKLKNFPVNEMKKLKRISGEKAWWVGLEWGAEGDNIRSKFDFMFTEI